MLIKKEVKKILKWCLPQKFAEKNHKLNIINQIRLFIKMLLHFKNITYKNIYLWLNFFVKFMKNKKMVKNNVVGHFLNNF